MDIDTQALRIASDNTPTPPTGKPWEELTHEQRARMDEIEGDMGYLMAEWESICNDRFPIVHNMTPVDD